MSSKNYFYKRIIHELNINIFIFRILIVFLIIAYLSAFITGFRLPNLWSLNYYIMNFFDGFIRRGAAGTILYIFGDLRANYYFIITIQFLVFIVLNYFIICAVIKDRKIIFIYSIFLISPFGGYFFHEIGYIDQLIFLVFGIIIIVDNKFFSAIMLFISLFIHELSIFTIIPLYFSYQYVKGSSLVSLIPTFLTCLLGMGLLYFYFQRISSEDLSSYLTYLTPRANYEIRRDFYGLFHTNFSISDPISHLHFTEEDYRNIKLISPLFLIIGYLFAKMKFLMQYETRWGSTFSATPGEQETAALLTVSTPNPVTPRRASVIFNWIKIIFLFFIGIMTPAVPLIMGMVAWDCARWIFISGCIALFCCYFTREALSWRITMLVSTVFIVFSIYGNFFYFDGYLPRAKNWDSIINFFTVQIKEEITTIPKV